MATFEVTFRRIAIVGTTGSGKTTLAGELGTLLNIPVYSLDSLQKDGIGHKIEIKDFLARIEEVSLTDSWIVDGGYKISNPILLQRAQAVIWLDYPLTTLLPRQLMRNLHQNPVISSVNPKKIANRFGNFTSLVRKTVRKHRQIKITYKTLPVDYPHLVVFHFTHPSQKQIWLRNLQLTNLSI
jgi:shikimate kinase